MSLGETIGIWGKQLKVALTGYGSCQFIIRDTGIGMKPESQQHILNYFQERKRFLTGSKNLTNHFKRIR